MNPKFNNWLYHFTQVLRGEFVFIALNELKRTTYFNEEQLLDLQADRLLRLLRYSITYSEFYKVHYKQFAKDIKKIDKKDVFTLFSELPILTKGQTIEEHDTIKSKKYHLTYLNISSGTTGEPFEFPCDRISWAYRHASIIRFLNLHGVRFGEKYGYFTGQHWRSESKRKTKMKDKFFNRYKLSAFNINEKTTQECYQWLLLNGATYIHGYPSAIYDFAKVASEISSLDLKALKLKVIMATGETLTTHQREYIEAKFGTPVRNYYGSVEGGAGAFEGPDGFLYENMESTHIYIENDEIYKTDLFLRKFPLIKFRTGDYTQNETTKDLPTLSHHIVPNILGRIGEKINLPSGRKVHSTLLSYSIDVFAAERQIRKFRFVFGESDILVLIEPIDYQRGIGKELENAIFKEMNKVFPDCELRLKYLERLPTLVNGKHRDWVYAKD